MVCVHYDFGLMATLNYVLGDFLALDPWGTRSSLAGATIRLPILSFSFFSIIYPKGGKKLSQ